jgi:4-hydroxy-3-methylbut-2-enyl diphosphate reductase
VRELSKQVDVLLVVGATNSSNSNRLCEIGAETGVPSYLVADGSELKADWFANAQTVGITAGASAPEEMVKHVINALRALGPVEVTTMSGREEKVEFKLPAKLTKPLAAATASAGALRED